MKSSSGVQARVLVVDDHPVVRLGLRAMLSADAALSVVAEADSAETALELAKGSEIDLALVELSLGHGKGRRFTGSGDASIVDQDIEFAEGASHLVEDALDIGFDRDVKVPESGGAARRKNAFGSGLALAVEESDSGTSTPSDLCSAMMKLR
jgi:hypothetical protein